MNENNKTIYIQNVWKPIFLNILVNNHKENIFCHIVHINNENNSQLSEM